MILFIDGAFKDRLEYWLKIQPWDSAGLRRLSDSLIKCEAAMSRVPSLHILNHERETRNISV